MQRWTLETSYRAFENAGIPAEKLKGSRTAVFSASHKWSRLFRFGKKLRIDISFNYMETGDLATSAQQGTKRRYPSASQEMLAERATQLDAEEAVTGQSPIWNHVYRVMRCPGSPCSLGPHCWIDNDGKKHYKLQTHHLKRLIRHVKDGGRLQTHDDVPVEIRELLYAEEQQDVERQRKRRAPSAACPPISITNVLPPQASNSYPAESTTVSTEVVASRPSTHLQIPEPLDIAVKSYTDWQCSRFSSNAVKREYQKACELTLAECLDLELVYEGQDAEFYIENGVKRGVAQRFVRDIEIWSKQYKAA
ncbi:hypothetical protein QBC46DRAFT_348385 [Diplogelasinospora grovesii]|uniref:Beta-ketoacyl synthase-like N-terminal domain-containing protein n=1 Tax=Diplogelasinospora grovesii TaxID=303347 RepID=A0AAN6MUH6_9PEZI|nr:hypothetical protein QBC46DRAFT_348385 [Diplogelasinospora grovesii]